MKKKYFLRIFIFFLVSQIILSSLNIDVHAISFKDVSASETETPLVTTENEDVTIEDQIDIPNTDENDFINSTSEPTSNTSDEESFTSSENLSSTEVPSENSNSGETENITQPEGAPSSENTSKPEGAPSLENTSKPEGTPSLENSSKPDSIPSDENIQTPEESADLENTESPEIIESPTTDVEESENILEGEEVIDELLQLENFLPLQMYAYPPNVAVVSNYDELSAALSGANGYDYIYISNDISQENKPGISIHPSKTQVTIDGYLPGNTVATFSQKSSLDILQTIYISPSNTSTKNVTIKNINLNGQNYFGIVSVYDGVNRVNIYYENIKFRGSQLTYNRGGSANFKDSDIETVDVPSSLAHEIAEANSIIFSGNINIISNTIIHKVIWLTGTNANFTVSQNSNVNIIAKTYFLYADGSYPKITLEENSSMILEGETEGFAYQAQQIDSLNLKRNSTLSIKQTKSNFAFGTLRINRELIMDYDSSLYIERAGGGSAIQFVAANANAFFDNPESVKLYAPTKRLFEFVASGTIFINTDAVNLWDNSTGFNNDSIDNLPTKSWNRHSGEILNISTRFLVNTQSSFTTNLNASDPTSNLTSATFTVNNSSMITFGKFSLTVDPVFQNSKNLSGSVEENSSIKIYNLSNSNTQIASSSLSPNNFSLDISTAGIAKGDTLSVLAYKNYLRKVENIIVDDLIEDGILRFIRVPSKIDFGIQTIPSEKTIIYRKNNEDVYIEIEDTRILSIGWVLSASIVEPLSTTNNGELSSLKDALIFIDDENQKNIFYTDVPIKIDSDDGSKKISWADDKGILLYVTPEDIISDSSYSTTIKWSLEDIP